MDVSVVGGGPGGAYAALLVKRAHPDWSVDVYEAYPAATTYGWGIVLPEKVYPVLREADAPTCERIRSVNTTWDPIDNYHRGERIRCGGHPYTSVMRADLLEILQARCETLGVEMHYETEADPVALAAESDLVVGADGLTSDTRSAYEAVLEPTLTRHTDVYAWFGTDRSFPALSHVYRETDDGVWHAAAYPGATATFIVDAAESTWRSAGLEDSSEAEYVAALEALFADVLDGHGLRSKEDRWRHFVTVETERWHHDNVVLLGDAAATAHYTIGSGTRMAMESAIALAEGLTRYPDDLQTALAWYEAERKPHVEALQAAADLSVTHFAHLDQYVHLPPMQLAFLYLTRTGYNGYEALRERDPGFVDDLDRWFARHVGGSADPARFDGDAVGPAGEPLDQPFRLADVTIPNRVVVEATPSGGRSGDSSAEERASRLAEAAASGAGLVTTGPVAVAPEGHHTSTVPGLYTDAQAAAWAAAVERAAEIGPARLGVELGHAGRRADTGANVAPDGEPLAQSATPYDADGQTPRAMAEADLDRARDAFVDAARRADRAGFDVLAIDAGGGSLLGDFLSPLVNRREDRYGGSPAARARYPLEVVEAVRPAWPAEKPLAVTLLTDDCVEGGFGVDDAFAVARALRDVGVDLVAPVAGGTVPDATPPADVARSRRYAHWVRNEVGVPTLSSATATTRDEATTVVASGRADLCRFRPPDDGA